MIFLTGHANVSASVRAMKAGAVDFLTKPVEAPYPARGAPARAGARRAASGRHARPRTRLRERFASLTPREREVFDRVVAGKLNKQIADELGIAERTVKLQRAQLMEKLGAASVAELGGLAEQLKHLSS